MKKLFCIGFFAFTLVAGDASAREIIVRVPPPHPHREVVVTRPSPRHVWIPGYYRWEGHRHTWVRGYWAVPPHRHAVWVPGHWTPRHGGHVWIAGYWR